jgi:hypothetical protein
MKYEPDDIVKIVDIRGEGEHWDQYDSPDQRTGMGAWLGQEVTIGAYTPHRGKNAYAIMEDCGRYTWFDHMITGLVSKPVLPCIEEYDSFISGQPEQEAC